MRSGAAIIAALALAGCSRSQSPDDDDASRSAATRDRVRCAIGGANAFKPDCTREIAQGPDGEVWVIHQPGGGFRRFVLIDGGTHIAAADGAEEVRAERVGPDLEVRIAGDRYLFPAGAPTASSEGADAAKR